jgi:hypothetical protein
VAQGLVLNLMHVVVAATTVGLLVRWGWRPAPLAGGARQGAV